MREISLGEMHQIPNPDCTCDIWEVSDFDVLDDEQPFCYTNVSTGEVWWCPLSTFDPHEVEPL